MDNLPKRDDTIYQEIESFEDYELTQCVAYEMAIRNKNIQNVFQNYIDGFCVGKHLKKQMDTYHVPREMYFDYLYRIGILERDNELSIENIFIKYKHLFESFLISDKYSTEVEENLNFMAILRLEKAINQKIEDSIGKVEAKRFIQRKQGVSFGSEIKQDVSPFIHKSRASLCIPKEYDRATINLELNLALPKQELLKQLEKIKDSYDADNNNLKSQAELLGETLEDATPKKDYPKKPTAQKMADMFFIYDYVKVRLKNIQKENKNNTIELEEEIENIKKYHTGADRKKRIAYAKAEYLESNIDTKITDIFQEDELTKILNLSGANISKLYYAIKPYIDDLKYKELITGVSTK